MEMQSFRSESHEALRVEMRFKNARLYDEIVAVSVPVTDNKRLVSLQRVGPVKSFCELHGLEKNRVYQLLNLKMSPIAHDNRGRPTKVKPLCKRLSDILMVPVDELFPADLYAIHWHAVAFNIAPKVLSLSSRSLKHDPMLIAAPAQDGAMYATELRERMNEVLETLTPREVRVLRLRYGVNDTGEHTLEEVGSEFAVTKERIRQIEAKALRKLRHPSRARKLRPFLDSTVTVWDKKPTPEAAAVFVQQPAVPTTAAPVDANLDVWRYHYAIVHATQSDLRTGAWCPEDVLQHGIPPAGSVVTTVRVPTTIQLPESDGRALIRVTIRYRV